MRTNELKESMINWLREHKNFKKTLYGENRTKKIYAGIRDGKIRYQEYASDCEEMNYPLVDMVIAL